MSLLRRITIFSLSIVAFVGSASSQNLIFNVDFDTYFDNREYSPLEGLNYRSGTDFAASLSPTFGLELDRNSTLYFGMRGYSLFEENDNHIFDAIETILYYGYDSEQWSASAGIFPRSRMAIESYSTAFFADDYLFYDSLVSGIMGQYRAGDSFVEFVCDWESQPSESSRERFRLLSAGRLFGSMLYGGYNLSITHFAGQELAGFDNVVDNILVNPRLGARFSGAYDLDVSVAYLASLQRDRSYDGSWIANSMGEFSASLSRWGFTLSEQLYIGGDMLPLYDGVTLDDGTEVEYGALLYTGDPLFRADGGFYNRAAVGYNRSFLDGDLSLGVQFVTHINGSGMGTEQIFNLAVKIGGELYRGKKQR